MPWSASGRTIMSPHDAPRPLIIPVFIPHAGCPHQCVFCDQHAITGFHSPLLTAESAAEYIRYFLAYRQPYHSPVQISFFGGNFLGLKDAALRLLLDTAAQFVKNDAVDGIRFSTRPDSITPHHIDILRDFPVQTIELGVQSMDDGVLERSRRGHTSRDTEAACKALQHEGYEVGLQMMVGLPGDSQATALTTAARIVDLAPDFVRIYPTLVLKNSRLAVWYHQGRYQPLSLEAGVSLVKQAYRLFRLKGIPVIRMGLQASEAFDDRNDILAGPYHPAFGHLVHSELFFDMAAAELAAASTPIPKAKLFVHPASLSKMRGLKNANLTRLKAIFQINSIELLPDSSLPKEDLRVKITA